MEKMFEAARSVFHRIIDRIAEHNPDVKDLLTSEVEMAIDSYTELLDKEGFGVYLLDELEKDCKKVMERIYKGKVHTDLFFTARLDESAIRIISLTGDMVLLDEESFVSFYISIRALYDVIETHKL